MGSATVEEFGGRCNRMKVPSTTVVVPFTRSAHVASPRLVHSMLGAFGRDTWGPVEVQQMFTRLAARSKDDGGSFNIKNYGLVDLIMSHDTSVKLLYLRSVKRKLDKMLRAKCEVATRVAETNSAEGKVTFF